MEGNDPNIWFPAKRYGWGWGPPRNWQGWAVIYAYGALMLVGVSVFSRGLPFHPLHLIVFIVVMQMALFATCLAKGEKPRWRWGKD